MTETATTNNIKRLKNNIIIVKIIGQIHYSKNAFLFILNAGQLIYLIQPCPNSIDGKSTVTLKPMLIILKAVISSIGAHLYGNDGVDSYDNAAQLSA